MAQGNERDYFQEEVLKATDSGSEIFELGLMDGDVFTGGVADDTTVTQSIPVTFYKEIECPYLHFCKSAYNLCGSCWYSVKRDYYESK